MGLGLVPPEDRAVEDLLSTVVPTLPNRAELVTQEEERELAGNRKVSEWGWEDDGYVSSEENHEDWEDVHPIKPSASLWDDLVGMSGSFWR